LERRSPGGSSQFTALGAPLKGGGRAAAETFETTLTLYPRLRPRLLRPEKSSRSQFAAS